MKLPKLTFWRVVFVALLIAGAYATYLRFFHGLGASTNLSDEFPWGIWIGFDILCGVMLAAGGFTLMATVHIFNAEKYHAIVRPALLTAFLGYLLVCAALMFDLGKPWRIWHPLVMWNPHSVMFEVGWCVTLYTTVLALEFSPIVFERLRFEKALRVLRFISIPLVILGVLLSTLHQSSLGTLYLIVPEKLHPLWYTPILPVLFFVSAIGVGLAMTIFESSMSERHFGHRLNMNILTGLARILTVVLAVFALLRIRDLAKRGVLHMAFESGYENHLFQAEFLLGVAIPLVLLAFPKVRASRTWLYAVSIFVVFGFAMNRLNVAITGMETSSGVRYIPKWTEIVITLNIVAVGFLLFTLAVKYLPIFSREMHTIPREERETSEALARSGAPLPEPAES